MTEVEKKIEIEPLLEKRGVSLDSFRVIKQVLYPNVKNDATLLMAIDYCKARNLDIMKRSIQIVPIWDSGKKQMVDTIWPSITEIRTTATRTGQYAGKSEAEFGPEVSEKIGADEVIYPKWCKIIVYRLLAGQKCEFAAKLFWKEAYKKGKDEVTPNSMWKQRPYAQLEKCVEAAALRSAFPEEIGNEFIAEEAFMETKDITPKSKTAAAHAAPPPIIDASFEDGVKGSDGSGSQGSNEKVETVLPHEQEQSEMFD